MASLGLSACIAALVVLQGQAFRRVMTQSLTDMGHGAFAMDHATINQSSLGAHTALVVIDVQDCFLNATTASGDPGRLAVANSHTIIEKINALRQVADGCLWGSVVSSQDFHPPHHISFASVHDGKAPFDTLPLTCINPDHEEMETEADASCCPDYVIEKKKGGEELPARFASTRACTYCIDQPEKCIPNAQTLWPDHCVQGYGDEDFSPALIKKDSDIVVQKGTNIDVDSYSAFRDNTKSIRTTLDGILKKKKIKTVFLAGIAEDVCVKFSALDAAEMGYKVVLIEDASKGLTEENEVHTTEELRGKGVDVVTTEMILNHAHELQQRGC